MNNLLRHKISILLLLTGTLFLTLTACDNSVGHDDHDHDHGTNPYGIVLTMNGVEIAKQEGGDIVYNNDSHIDVVENEQTSAIQVRWLNDHGETFLPDTEDGYSLRWTIADEDVLGVVQHEDDGAWNFHLEGKTAGETTISFMLWHNDYEHFTSLQFDVDVQPAGSSGGS